MGDGAGGMARCTVTDVRRGAVTLEVTQRRSVDRDPVRFTVVQALAKGDRGELAVESMTEAGVDAILPWAASRSVVRWEGERGERSAARWARAAREASKQSRRAWLPQIDAPASTGEVACRLAGADAAFVLDGSAEVALGGVDLPVSGSVVCVVGPEGGIDPAELATFTAAGARAVRLGPGVLRTSTAGVAALAVLATRTGRWS